MDNLIIYAELFLKFICGFVNAKSMIWNLLMSIPYTRKFSRYEIFAVHQANRIFAIIFLRITYYNFSWFLCELLHYSRFVAYTCFHMAAKIASYYFQHQKDRLGLLNSVSQICIDWSY